MTSALPPTLYYSGIPYNNQFFQGQNSISTSYLDANYLKKVGIANSTATQTTFSGSVYVSGQGTDVGTQLNGLTTKTTNMSYTSGTTSFTGTIHGSLDASSTINGISAGYYDVNGSLTSAFSGKQNLITSSTALSLLSISATGTISTSGTLHGAIDSSSTINSISALNYDYNGSLTSAFNGKQPTITSLTALSVASLTATGALHGALDSSSTINSISALNYDYNGSLTSAFNGKQPTITSLTALSVASLNANSGTIITTGTLHGLLDSTSKINNIIASNFDYNGSLNTAISTLNTQTTNMSYATGTTSFGTNNISFSGSINAIPSATLAFINTLSSNAQTQLNTLQTKTTALSYSGTTSSFTGTIHGSLDSSSSINNILASNFDYNASLNTAISALNTQTTNMTYTAGTTSFGTNNISFSGTINTIPSATLAFINTLSSNAQTQLNTLQTKTTGLSYSGTTSSFSGNIHGALDSSSTINSINASNYDYNGSLNGAITTLNTKTTNLSYASNCSTFTGETQVNDLASTNSLAIGNNLEVAGISNLANLQVLNNISCAGLNAIGSVQYDFKMVGYLTNAGTYGMIPLCKTILNSSTFCNGSINLNNLFINSIGINLFLFPLYKIVMYDNNGIIVFSGDNTTGIDMGFYSIAEGINVSKIFIYNNNVCIL